ncbi:MAG: bifunctional UDP-N-acetylglucosamine diphosphorylase/glucosamine-1-phosphate N-acetyltransferase GlmU [Desulfuromonadaceae bacterium]|nr:bifunctional UDP-N-acetylglucosamine diphosphorylase/glucosamine-1-phosphate N-acetyltransferase GlmU [Desulfuromonadaceae bacterium]MDD2848847.1 bifunctional UDP-N-acetylglucosamine diphosphorylase/glucosamine-1-phosphate N-acetyltransferase GlmU [Desulfuromonadaceae bacterium]MDD4132196.1 bifunctional UDP-N-acetylglucosamine diphosphorylase/glucosamine-1-phosphate N-acetyltransferase GlmU [Desulfuromonadaceae bacterium]
MESLASVVLAAGKGTRMKSALIKVLHPIAGQPMITWPVTAAREAGSDPIVLVIGHQANAVQGTFRGAKDILCAMQEEQLGTGHAVACALDALAGFRGTVLILCGDTPLLRAETLKNMLAFHRDNSAAVTVLTAMMDDPYGYGRVVRDPAGRVTRIVEQKDADPEEQEIREINSGIYCMDSDFLYANIKALGNNNAQQEYYLTDLLAIAVRKELTCLAIQAADADEIMGINDRIQLASAGRILRSRINREHMLNGVTIIDPENTYIDHGVTIGCDTTIHPGCNIGGGTVIGEGCLIDGGVSITGCRIGDDCHIKAASVLEDSELGEDVTIGPMAHLRPGTVLGNQVKIGNFVETKKIVMGKGSKASHLTYLGDAEIGCNVNIGCGTITCNYDGVNKHRTVIGDDVFIGSDVQLVAPVTVGRNSLVAAGTTVTSDVPPDSLTISRVPQVNKEGWRLKKK